MVKQAGKRGLEENSDFDSSDDEYEPIKQETESEWWIQLYIIKENISFLQQTKKL